MFSSSRTTLSILKEVSGMKKPGTARLYAIVPYVFEFVRMAVTEGGIPGLAKKVGTEIVTSANIGSIFYGLHGAVFNNPSSLLKAYLLYEETQIKKAAGRDANLYCIFLHEVVTDMALALEMKWLFETHIGYMRKRGIKPGIHTHNLPFLITKFKDWGIDTRDLVLTTQFNPLGFGMTPSREECEDALRNIPGAEVVAYGILASGYLKPQDAAAYLAGIPRITGAAIGVSRETHAKESFKVLRGAG